MVSLLITFNKLHLIPSLNKCTDYLHLNKTITPMRVVWFPLLYKLKSFLFTYLINVGTKKIIWSKERNPRDVCGGRCCFCEAQRGSSQNSSSCPGTQWFLRRQLQLKSTGSYWQLHASRPCTCTSPGRLTTNGEAEGCDNLQGGTIYSFKSVISTQPHLRRHHFAQITCPSCRLVIEGHQDHYWCSATHSLPVMPPPCFPSITHTRPLNSRNDVPGAGMRGGVRGCLVRLSALRTPSLVCLCRMMVLTYTQGAPFCGWGRAAHVLTAALSSNVNL